jgi:putative restriction endonuclease
MIPDMNSVLVGVDSRNRWLHKLGQLNPNRSKAKGAAPHKPSLLLSLLDMAQDGELQQLELKRTPGLNVRFNAFSSLALPRWGGRVDLSYPFYYLKSQGFWQALDEVGRAAASVDATKSVRFDPEFLALMLDAEFRRCARIILVETYFPPEERVALYALLGVRSKSPEFQKELHLLREDAAQFAVKQGRSARFAVQVVCAYQHTCALTGYRVITADGASGVEAAHIEPWASTRNDDILNGLALSHNAHWAFDRGLWSVDDHHNILIKDAQFQEWGPNEVRLAGYRGRKLHFAPAATLRPDVEYLRRHRDRWRF